MTPNCKFLINLGQAGFWTELMEKNCMIFVTKKLSLLIFWTFFGLRLLISKKVWNVIGLGLSFENSGLDLDRNIWQSAHLWCFLNVGFHRWELPLVVKHSEEFQFPRWVYRETVLYRLIEQCLIILKFTKSVEWENEPPPHAQQSWTVSGNTSSNLAWQKTPSV